MTGEIETGPVATYRTGQVLLAEFQRSGAEAAFEEIVRLYAGMVYSVCLNVTKNAHDAEDSAQATFLALATQVKTGKEVKCLGPWLRQVAKRTALDLRKSRIRREKREEKQARFNSENRFDGHVGEAKLDAEDYKIALHDELNKLPARYREPLIMHYFGGLRPEQAALELNCKPKTLAVRMHRGRKLLQQNLNRRGIFVGGEMLGLASMAFMQQMIGPAFSGSTAHAAVGITGGYDISAIVAPRVMSLLRSSAKVAIFAKFKFLAAMLVVFSSVVAGGAQVVRTGGLQNIKLPDFKIRLMDWIRPMMRSIGSPRVMTAQATLSGSDGQTANAAIAGASWPADGWRSAPQFISYDPSQARRWSGDFTLINHDDVYQTVASSAGFARRGSSELRLTPATAPSNGDLSPTLVEIARVNPNSLVLLQDGQLVRRTVQTPEPGGILSMLAGGSLLLVRRRNAATN